MPETILWNFTPENTEKAGAVLRQGGLVAIPTETVYGLAANAFDGEAASRIYAAKGRPSDNPLIVHIASLDQLPALVTEVPEAAYRLAERFWPGACGLSRPAISYRKSSWSHIPAVKRMHISPVTAAIRSQESCMEGALERHPRIRESWQRIPKQRSF